MKKVFQLSLALITTGIINTQIAHAAIPMKQEAAKTEVVVNGTNEQIVSNPTMDESNYVQTAEKTATKTKAGSATIPKILYIVLAIIGWGWLAMGINDNFGDFDWLISLVLYFLFYLPGLIYTLIKMKKYY